MGTVTTVQENAADILASAKELNEDRAAKEAEEAAAANLESEEALIDPEGAASGSLFS